MLTLSCRFLVFPGKVSLPPFPSLLGYLFSSHADSVFRTQASERARESEQGRQEILRKQREKQWVVASDVIETASCR